MANALIIGAGGQDGTLLSKFLENIGMITIRVFRNDPFLLYDPSFLRLFFLQNRIDHVYYLAAHHRSSSSIISQADEEFALCFKTHVEYVQNVLNAIRLSSPNTRFFYASSSLVFGNPDDIYLTEESKRCPICDYGMTKKMGMDIVEWFREKYNIFASSAILFNHESSLRKDTFLSKMIIRTAVEIKCGKKDKLVIGDLSAETDWGFAPDYVKAFYAILQADRAGDFIVSSGELHKVQDWIEIVFDRLKLDWREYVEEDKRIISRKKRAMIGDNTKIRSIIGWEPETAFERMVEIMLEEETKNNA